MQGPQGIKLHDSLRKLQAVGLVREKGVKGKPLALRATALGRGQIMKAFVCQAQEFKLELDSYGETFKGFELGSNRMAFS